jgi:hypothetical protein
MRPAPYEPGQEPKVSFTPVFTFDQAMKGGGVGINVQRKYVGQIPKVRNSVELQIICDTQHKDMMEVFNADGRGKILFCGQQSRHH